MYDFGPLPNVTSRSPAFSPITVQVVEITAPVWLDTQAIRYRLVYHDPAQTYTYANSRWAAPPAKLLTERIRQHFAVHINRKNQGNKDHPSTDYLLKIELEEFIQVFENQNDSRVTVRLRASLYERGTRSLIRLRNFSNEQTTPTADAAGAVAAFILAGDQLSDELIQWLSDIFRQKTMIPTPSIFPYTLSLNHS